MEIQLEFFAVTLLLPHQLLLLKTFKLCLRKENDKYDVNNEYMTIFTGTINDELHMMKFAILDHFNSLAFELFSLLGYLIHTVPYT